jgi:two-component system LytT family response regulator
MNIRAVVVDDEILARTRLQNFLAEEPDLEIIGECADGRAAVDFILKHHPDLVFLDVKMPQFSGFDVLRALPPEGRPAIIFVTAHDRYAVEAFETQAMDYLLKPFNRSRLQEAVRRARLRLQAPPSVPVGQSVPQTPPADTKPPRLTRFAVKDGNQTHFIKIQDVDYIEAAANYVVLCTQNGNYVLRETMQNLETTLPPELFLRISRAVIINLERIKSIRSELPGENVIVLQKGREFPMTRGLKEVRERLQYSALQP